ncbi:MAG: F0F1 ATP synthase subunit beta, partial [Candidatus Jettenia caeni]|nr:F0F1 ATP synthase subunit beta [Candidatus Jettenia caeni]
MNENDDLNRGTVISVRGSVIDAHFPYQLPAIRNQLRAGDHGKIVIEVIIHLDSETIRGIALTPTQGLFRGAPVADLGQPLKVPVGKQLLSRIFNVFGETIDKK